MPTESCLNQGKCEPSPDGNGECKVRKQPRNGPREEKVPYLIISSHNEKHTARGFYMAAAAGVGFPLARVRLCCRPVATGYCGSNRRRGGPEVSAEENNEGYRAGMTERIITVSALPQR
ncbi:hypothetical protein D9C73_012707 [Collichthys lucidus]|uniref:Uncharacterized protein n=1 Tax=Collichthys lucidus TaxID=240159 RepID=A0A4U5UTH8_COLLU|nr:hypothetical protein D9C73_012707 [Collichthys lucidus]